MSHKDHHSDLLKDLGYLIIVTSDILLEARSRGETPADESGDIAESLILEAHSRVVGRLCLHNDVDAIRNAVDDAARKGSADVIVISGGTGLGPKDKTIEAVSPLIEKTLPGFGELFRQLSFGEVGTAAVASRAFAGSCGKAVIFTLPGSPKAVRLAMERLIIPEAPHLIKMLRG